MVVVGTSLLGSLGAADGAAPINETDLRQMLEDATGFRPDDDPTRWVIQTRHAGDPWEVIVEPQYHTRILDVITA